MSGTTAVSPTHAWKRNGATCSICFIRIAPSDPANAALKMNRSPADTAKPGRHTTSNTPASVSVMPSPRRQWIRSPRIRIDSKVVIGTPACSTTAALDGDAVCNPRNSNAKLPPPINAPTSTIRHAGRGIGRNHGNVTTSTIAKRAAAKNNGGTCQVPTTTLLSTLLKPQVRHTNTSKRKSRKRMTPSVRDGRQLG